MWNKLNDITKDLDKQIDLLKNNKSICFWEKLNNSNNLNDIYKALNKINLADKKKIKKTKIKVSKIKIDKLKNQKKKFKKHTLSYIKYIKTLYEKRTDYILKIKKHFIKIKNLSNNKKSKKIKKIKFNNKNILNKNFFILLFSFFIIISLLFITDKIIIEQKINSWYKNILAIKNNPSDIKSALKQINDSKYDFIYSTYLFQPFKFIPNKQIANAYNIINGWKKLTIFLEKGYLLYDQILKEIGNTKNISNLEISDLIINYRDDFSDLHNLLYEIILSYNNIKELKNNDMQLKIDNILQKMKKSYNIFTIINRDFDKLLDIIWHDSPKKYLIMFQNNDEIRPTWWFAWSLWLVTIYNWKIVDFKKDDIYAYEWEINKNYTNKIKAPKWLDQITWTFWLRDANYYISTSKSSYNIKKFLEMWNFNVDWIIYLNQNS